MSTAEPTTNGKVLNVTGLRKTYESEGVPVRALRGVDVSIEEGEFVAVMGPSGCGKSTLLNLIAGLDNVTLPAIIAGTPRREAESRARDLLDLLGLADKARTAPGVLSGGQRQR